MARDDSPPFAPGDTFYGLGAVIDTTDQTTGENLCGKEWVFEDIDYSQGYNSLGGGAKPERSGKKVVRRAVRNASGTTLYPQRLVQFCAGTNAAGTVAGDRFGCWVSGNQNVSDMPCYPVDEFVNSGGVAPNDIFYIVTEGPCRILTDLTTLTAGTGNINIGDQVGAGTFASSTSSTGAGRIVPNDWSAATTVSEVGEENAVAYRVGFALTAATSGNTNTSVLVSVKRWD